MAKKEKKNEQNIDGVLEELKKSYSVDASSDVTDIESESASSDVSHDELQARLRSQFLSDEIQKSENASTDDYSIDEDFLKDAYDNTDFEKNNDENISQNDEQNEEIIEKTGVKTVANNYSALIFNPDVIGAGLNVYNTHTANAFNKPFITAESELGERVDFPYMTLRHCPIKNHCGFTCVNCGYEEGYELKMDSGKTLKLKRKKLSTCTFYLVD